MEARLKLKPGQKGTKRLLELYGSHLVCVRYRYDEQRHKRYKTVELIVEETPWNPPPIRPDKLIAVRVAVNGVDLQRWVKAAGGRWDPRNKVWELRYDRAMELGLEARIEKRKASNTRNLNGLKSI